MPLVFDSLSALPRSAALAVGTFDGVHLGHQAVLAGMREFAKASDCAPWVLSFEGAPRGDIPARIYDVELQTHYLLEQGGALIRQTFTPEFSSLSAIDFVKQLKGAEIFCGADWRFGKGAEGNIAFLQRIGITPHVMPYVQQGGERISSTRIRAAIMAGEMSQVKAMLGRTWEFRGKVCHGRGLAGKTFGVPTLNLPYHGRAGERLVPLAKGVYHGWAEVTRAGEILSQGRALINFGTAPSVKGLEEPLFEVHLLETSGDFYGCEVTLRIERDCVRSERKFSTLAALHMQILEDLARCKEDFRE